MNTNVLNLIRSTVNQGFDVGKKGLILGKLAERSAVNFSKKTINQGIDALSNLTPFQKKVILGAAALTTVGVLTFTAANSYGLLSQISTTNSTLPNPPVINNNQTSTITTITSQINTLTNNTIETNQPVSPPLTITETETLTIVPTEKVETSNDSANKFEKFTFNNIQKELNGLMKKATDDFQFFQKKIKFDPSIALTLKDQKLNYSNCPSSLEVHHDRAIIHEDYLDAPLRPENSSYITQLRKLESLVNNYFCFDINYTFGGKMSNLVGIKVHKFTA